MDSDSVTDIYMPYNFLIIFLSHVKNRCMTFGGDHWKTCVVMYVLLTNRLRHFRECGY